MSEPRPREFAWYEGLAFCLAAVATQFTSEFISQWGLFFYRPTDTGQRIIYVSMNLAGLIFALGVIVNAVTTPLIGVWSDRTRSHPGWARLVPIRGRRRPFIFWGSVLMLFTMAGLWHPPHAYTSSANFVFATLVVCLHWVFWSTCCIPLLALQPEVARSKEARLNLGVWVAVGMIVGLAVVEIIPPILVKSLDPARHAAEATATAAPTFSPIGYQRTGLLLGVFSLLLFQLPVWLVRERHESKAEQSTLPWAEISSALRNRPFQLYVGAFFLFSIGLLAIQKVLPYWATIALRGEESDVSILMAPFIVMALVSYTVVPSIARRVPIKWLMLASFAIFTIGFPLFHLLGAIEATRTVKLALGMALCGFCGFGQGISYVMLVPLLGEIIDLDEHTTGRRREAVYQGLSGIITLLAQVVAIAVATQSMAHFGSSIEQPRGIFLVGTFAGGFGLLGMVVMAFYPVLHVTKDTTRELFSSAPDTPAAPQ